MRALLAAVVFGLAANAFAQNAQDELERQLKDMVGKPPTKLHVEYEGLDQPNYKLVEISFTLDGQALPTPSVEKLNEGKTTIWHGDIKPGTHRLETNAVLTDISGVLFSYEAGYKWKVRNTRSFDQAPGLEVHVIVTPELSAAEKDPTKKFALRSTATVKMLAKLEDGTMPDVPKPNIKTAEEVPDAGTGAAVAELTPAEKARQAAADKAAEKKRQKEEALAAKKAAAEEAKRQRDEAAAEKKRQREEALAAKKAAAEDAKRQREEAAAAKKAGTGEKVAAADKTGEKVEPVAEPAKTPEPEAVPDAGAPAVAAAEPVKPVQAPPAATPAPVEDKSSMMPIYIGGGVALLGIIVFLATRRRKS